MNDRIYVEYNRSNKDRARQNRTNQTKAEQLVRGILRKNQLGYVFLRQKMINSFILDFYCSFLLLGIEVDGESHDYSVEYDAQRSIKIGKLGIKIIRYKNQDVYNDLEGVCKNIIEEINLRYQELYL